MEITWLGWILIPVFCYCLVCRPNWLLYSALFFCGFSATAVINLIDVRFGIQAYQLAIIFLVARFLLIVISGRFRANPSSTVVLLKISKYYLLFLAIDVAGVFLGGVGTSSTAITQFFHLVFGGVAFFVIAYFSQSYHSLKRLLSILFAGALFVSAWGLLQFILHSTGIHYPDYLFNNTSSKNSLAFDAVSEGLGYFRISSVATEPSMLTKYLIPVLGAMMSIILDSWHHLDRKIYLKTLVVLAAVLISTSSGGYIGIFVIFLFLVSRMRILFRRRMVSIGVLVIMMLLVALALRFPSVLDEIIFSKMYTYSFMERMESIVTGWNIFHQHPFFGIGWGNFEGWDMVIKVIASTGIFGLLAFGYFNYSVFRNASKVIRLKPESNDSIILRALIVASLLELFQMAIVGFFPAYGDYWVLFGLMAGMMGHSIEKAKSTFMAVQR
jgi:hypothetical protein